MPLDDQQMSRKVEAFQVEVAEGEEVGHKEWLAETLQYDMSQLGLSSSLVLDTTTQKSRIHVANSKNWD